MRTTDNAAYVIEKCDEANTGEKCMFMDIAISKDWKEAIPISKGWSSDKKYLIETAEGEQ